MPSHHALGRGMGDWSAAYSHHHRRRGFFSRGAPQRLLQAAPCSRGTHDRRAAGRSDEATGWWRQSCGPPLCTLRTQTSTTFGRCAAEPPENTVMPAVRCERCFYSDAGHHWTDAQWARRRQATCPYGCGVPCTWMHFAFECTGDEVRTLQQRWAEKAADLLELAEPLSGHEDLSLCVVACDG